VGCAMRTRGDMLSFAIALALMGSFAATKECDHRGYKADHRRDRWLLFRCPNTGFTSKLSHPNIG
jgi:hypothetical protein